MAQIETNQADWLASHQWNENIPCPMGDRLAVWQKKLNKLFGMIRGEPMLRVVWGQDPTTWVYNRYLGQHVPRYDWGYISTWVTDPATGISLQKRKWIGLPRLIVERAMLPRKIETSHTFDVDGVPVDPEKILEPVEYQRLPVHGLLVRHSSIKDRDGNSLCCVRTSSISSKCFGDYREIDDQDLEMFKMHLAVDAGTVIVTGVE